MLRVFSCLVETQPTSPYTSFPVPFNATDSKWEDQDREEKLERKRSRQEERKGAAY